MSVHWWRSYDGCRPTYHKRPFLIRPARGLVGDAFMPVWMLLGCITTHIIINVTQLDKFNGL